MRLLYGLKQLTVLQTPRIMGMCFLVWGMICTGDTAQPLYFGVQKSQLLLALAAACLPLTVLTFFIPPLKHFYLDVCVPRIQWLQKACGWCDASWCPRRAAKPACAWLYSLGRIQCLMAVDGNIAVDTYVQSPYRLVSPAVVRGAVANARAGSM